MKKIILSLSLLMVAATTPLFAQKTGSFNETIEFNSDDRTLSCFVPSDYDSNQSYRLMIGLHGLGDNSNNFRRSLINILQWDDLFENTIFVCPDGGEDEASDFYAPVGDEQIIEAAIQFATTNYNINEEDILLEGFSLGGRSALKYGLDYSNRFNGLLLNTPALQGIADLANDPNAALSGGYDYERANEVPIYMTIGAEDITYTGVVGQLEKILVKNDARLEYEIFLGMGHSLPKASKAKELPLFFENPNPNALDIELFAIESDVQYCSEEVSPNCVVRNLGRTAISSVVFKYSLNGNESSFEWKGTLQSNEHAVVALPSIKGLEGTQMLSVAIEQVNGNRGDDEDENDEQTLELRIAAGGKSLPFTEEFESPLAWKSIETGNLFTWYHDETVGHNSKGSMNAFNNILFFYTQGYEEHMFSPVVDLSTSASPGLTFDLSYNYHRYTAPYFTEETFFADTLVIAISTDCGQSFTELYKKGGSDLATFEEPILNPLSIEQGMFVPKEEDWKTVGLDLSDYREEKAAMIRFTYKSGMGGSIFIDNARFDKALSVEPTHKTPADFGMYPNPALNQLNLVLEPTVAQQIRIFDMTGKVMAAFTASGNTSIALDAYPNGYYQVEVWSEGVSSRKALVVSR